MQQQQRQQHHRSEPWRPWCLDSTRTQAGAHQHSSTVACSGVPVGVETKEVFECSDSSKSMDIADPWNGSQACYQGLFHFVNEAYDLGYQVQPPPPCAASAVSNSAPSTFAATRATPNNKSANSTGKRRRHGRLAFTPHVNARDPDQLHQRYLQFSVAPHAFRQTALQDHSDSLTEFGTPL